MKEIEQTSGLKPVLQRCYMCSAKLQAEWRHCPNCGHQTLTHCQTIGVGPGITETSEGKK